MAAPRMFDEAAGRAGRLDVTVNGDGERVAASTLAEAVVELGFGDALVATALNGKFVPASARSGIVLATGDSIEIVAPRAGG